jgi:hypothetical protein
MGQSMTITKPTYNDLVKIQIHMGIAISNIAALHTASEGEKVCSECNVSDPCLTIQIVRDQLKHIDRILKRLGHDGAFDGRP